MVGFGANRSGGPMPTRFRVVHGWFGGTPALRLSGPMTFDPNLRVLQESVDRLVSRGPARPILDVGGVNTTDSSGIGVLLMVPRDFGDGPPIVLARSPERLRRVLDLIHVTGLFEFVDTETELVRRFGAWRDGEPDDIRRASTPS